ncbi:MAG: lysophospholipase [Lachnospiraceae bacterium]|nr:lysophospholipase [Lachnospiraceae bacterium]
MELRSDFYINSDGIRLHAVLDRPAEGCKGALCILVHGFTGNMDEDLLKRVRDGMNKAGVMVLRVEMYGHGQSDGDFADHTLFKWISNAISVLRYVRSLDNVTDIYIAGHSQGGLLAMLTAAMYPDTIKALIPLSPAWMIPENARKGEMLGMAFDPDHIPDKLACWDHELSGDYLRTARMLHVEDEIARYHGPVLVIHGKEDEAVPYEVGRLASELYENARLVTIEGADHCYTGREDEVSEAVRMFIQEMTDVS